MTESPSVEEIQTHVEHLKEWIIEQPRLPKDMGDTLLRRFLHSCYYDMDRTKRTIENFTSIRVTSPDLFGNRDFDSPQFQKALKIVLSYNCKKTLIEWLKTLTYDEVEKIVEKFGNIKGAGKRVIWLNQLNDPGLQSFDYLQDARLFLILADAWLLEDEDMADADIVIMDMKDVSFKIFYKLSMSIAKKLARYQEEAMPIRLKQIHLLNVPSFIDKLFSLMKLFLKQDMTEMMHFHVPNSETLFEYVSRDELPKEFGGNLVSLDELTEHATNTLYKHRATLCKDNLWKVPEKLSKRNDKPSSSALSSPVPRTDMSPPFRSLSID